MITFVLLIIMEGILKAHVEPLSYDTQVIIFVMCIISDIHLLALGLKGGK